MAGAAMARTARLSMVVIAENFILTVRFVQMVDRMKNECSEREGRRPKSEVKLWMVGEDGGERAGLLQIKSLELLIRHACVHFEYNMQGQCKYSKVSELCVRLHGWMLA